MPSKLVLIVDDNLDARYVLGAILNHDGYRVVTAENGAEAVACAQKHRPDLILMDIAMPVMDGLTATRLIRERKETASTPVIALTGNTFSAEEREAVCALFTACFTKPIAPGRVLAEVQRLIGLPHA
jgi:CheY-like chemotaxis protein